MRDRVAAVAILLILSMGGGKAFENTWPENWYHGTGPCGGRMVQLSPPDEQSNLPWVHVVWDQYGPIYTHSTDNGENWVDLEYPEASWFPSLSVTEERDAWLTSELHQLSGNSVYLAVRRGSSNWPYICPWGASDIDGATVSVLSSTSNERMVYAVTASPASNETESSYVALYFLAFDTLPSGGPNPPSYSYVLATAPAGHDFEPTIDYTPGDLVHVAYKGPGDTIWYRTWTGSRTPDDLRASPQNPPTWDIARKVSAGYEPACQPSIDADGENVYCAWRGPNVSGQNIGEIYRRERYIGDWPPAWSGLREVSASPDLESGHPQCHTQAAVTWHEQVDQDFEVYASFNGDIVNISQSPDIMDYWAQAAIKNPVPPDPYEVDLHVLWSEEVPGTPPDRSIHYRLQEYVPVDHGTLDYPTYINAVLGESVASPYCKERTGYRAYGSVSVDFAESALVYELPFLDPARRYVLQAFLINGEEDTIRQRVVADGRAVASVTLAPGCCDTLLLTLPARARPATRLSLRIERVEGACAVLSNSLRVFEAMPRRQSDGVAGGTRLGGRLALTASPNPFVDRCLLSMDADRPSSVPARVCIFDASGRRVRALPARNVSHGKLQAAWDGTDSEGRDVPPGVYCCRVVSGELSVTVRVVKQ